MIDKGLFCSSTKKGFVDPIHYEKDSRHHLQCNIKAILSDAIGFAIFDFGS